MTSSHSSVPVTPILAVSSRMLRSPSHESVTTDLSVFSVSSLASEALNRHHRLLSFKSNEPRGPSPNPDTKPNRPPDIPEITWFEDGHDLIRSCAALSSVLGIQKSFSTGDITQINFPDNEKQSYRPTVSELALNSLQRCGYLLDNSRLEHASRSCSTWVAVGELASTSQLPSPHGGQTSVPALSANTPPPPAFTAADLIRSVNKKVRQNYIRKRLLTTYRALERLSQSEFNLDRLEAAAAAATAACGPGPTELIVPTYKVIEPQPNSDSSTSVTDPQPTLQQQQVPITATVISIPPLLYVDNKMSNVNPVVQFKKKITINLNKTLTMNDIERERGKPLSKYERNMMIFNWLHSLDENSIVEDIL